MDQLRVLIATTTWWPSAARLAVSFLGHGARVYAICPRGHPLRVLTAISSIHTYDHLSPLAGLIRAIKETQPDIIVPTDDRVVGNLHALYASVGKDDPGSLSIRTLIERSLGAPNGFALSGTRDRLLQAVKAAGVRVPLGREIGSVDDLSAWFDLAPGRCVLKAEGTWGGSGVVVVDTLKAAQAAFIRMSLPLTFRHALRLLLFDRDAFPFVQFLRGERRVISVQTFIEGRQANIMAACWKGRLLDTLAVEVIRAQDGTGAATVVRMVESRDMEGAAAIVASCLAASGFIGLDFMIEQGTEAYYLIEVNPRATQLGHLARHGRDLVSSLMNTLAGTPSTKRRRSDEDEVIALFPQVLRFDADWLERNRNRIDVPWTEPRLVQELLRRPWTKRSLLSQLEGWLRHNNAYGTVLSRRRAARALSCYQKGIVAEGTSPVR